MTDRGITYLLCGTKHNVMGAVSIRSLRQFWEGAVTIFADDKAMGHAKQIGRAADVDVVAYKVKRYRRNSAYAAKPKLPILSPYRHTVQLDADTMIVQPFEELWPRDDNEFVLTQFSDWTSTDKRITNRIKPWEDVAPIQLTASLAAPYPALNTGVISYGCNSHDAREFWAEMTDRKPDVFMSDELAAQLCLPAWNAGGHTRVLNDSFNWSPLYHSRPLKEARIIHFHGRKTLHPKAFDIWWPEYQSAIDENWAGLADWTPAGDKRLTQYLAGNDPYKEKRQP